MSKTVMNTMSAATKLSEAQMSMLNAAAQREDRCLTPALTLRGAQVVKAGEKLISAGFAREVKAKGSCPVWRRDSETGPAFALKLTAVGAKAIVRGGEALSMGAAAEKPPAPLTTAPRGPKPPLPLLPWLSRPRFKSPPRLRPSNGPSAGSLVRPARLRRSSDCCRDPGARRSPNSSPRPAGFPTRRVPPLPGCASAAML